MHFSTRTGFAVALVLAVVVAAGAPQEALAHEPDERTPSAAYRPVAGHHGGFWVSSPGYRSPALAAALSLTPFPVDFGNLYADNLGWGMGYTVVELSLATPLVILGAGHMCHGHNSGDECDDWSDSERGWAIGLLSGYVAVKLVATVHAGFAAQAYNERHRQTSSVGVVPLDGGGGLSWTIWY